MSEDSSLAIPVESPSNRLIQPYLNDKNAL